MQLENVWKTYGFIKYYHPWMRGLNPQFGRPDALILDLKDGKQQGIDSAVDEFLKAFDHLDLPPKTAIAIVPGHQASTTNKGTPLALVSMKIQKTSQRKFRARYNALKRYKTIEKLAAGGARSKSVHLDSIKVVGWRVKGKVVVIIDDVATSGNSLLACRELIESAGAEKVAAIALGQTHYE